jgi:anti-sigma factor RsiW
LTDPGRPIGEDDLHAYVDRQLEPADRRRVEQYLASDPDAARRVSAYQLQREALRAAFASRTEPVPPELRLSHILGQRRRQRWVPWSMAAAVALALGAGGAAGWTLHTQPVQSRVAHAMDVLERQALSTHAVFAADPARPVELSAVEEADLRQWLSTRLDRVVTPPDLSALGYHLIGGRLLATEQGRPAALFMYDNDKGDRISLVLRPMAPNLQASPSDMRQGDLNGCAWIKKGMGYAVVGAFPDDELDRVADHIRAENERLG